MSVSGSIKVDGIELNRGTGRSQRDIVRALSQAIMGKQVLFVSMTPESGRAHWQVACDWLEANGFIGYPNVQVIPHTNLIVMGKGSVLFSMGQGMSGPRLHGIQHIVEDHFVAECNAAVAAKQAEQEADKNTIARLMHKHQWGIIEGYGVQCHSGVVHKAKLRLNLRKRTAE